MWVETSIALRFLRQGRAQTLLILVGIAVGVSVIVFVVALIAGLQANIIDRTLGTQSHLRVEAPEEINRIAAAPPGTLQLVLEDRRAQTLRPINNWQQVRDVLERLPGITAVSPIVSGPAFGRRGEAVESVALIGMDLPRYLRVIPLHNHMVDGRLEVGSGNAVIGRQLARDLGLRSGGKLRLEAGDGRDALVNVAGIFELGVRELDARYVYLDLSRPSPCWVCPGRSRSSMPPSPIWMKPTPRRSRPKSPMQAARPMRSGSMSPMQRRSPPWWASRSKRPAPCTASSTMPVSGGFPRQQPNIRSRPGKR